MGDSSKALIGSIAALVALVLCVLIMARCQMTVELTDARIADCAKSGGHWNYNGGQGFCETQK
jgi:hypothetical protein